VLGSTGATTPAATSAPPALMGAWLLSLRSAQTRTAYAADLEAFTAHLRPLGLELATAPRVAVDLWVETMTAAGLKPATIARRLAAVRSFYRYARDVGALVGVDPTTGVRTPHVPNEAVKAGLTLSEVRALVAWVTADGTDTMRAGVALLFGAALRVSEAVAATVNDITDIDGHTVLSVTGKGGRRRPIPLSPLALELLDPVPQSGHLITTADGEPCNRYQLGYVVRTAALGAGITRTVSPHILRHTAATIALDGGAPIQTVADLLGHSSPTTTMRYVAGRERLRDSAAYVLAATMTTGGHGGR
jgi:integrase/recombinase XerD